LRQHYNTNRLRGVDLDRAVKKNARQQDIVLAFFKERPRGLFATYQVHEAVMSHTRMTSTQRCITNLTDQGALIKTESMVMGPMGMQVHTWKLNTGEREQLKLFS
jgi:hypothetical protein